MHHYAYTGLPKSTHVMLTTLNVAARLQYLWAILMKYRHWKEAFQYKSNLQEKRLNRTVLGAVKANLGHTDAASGAAGVITMPQMLKERDHSPTKPTLVQQMLN
ncbi:hypothetical protein KCP69_26720 (plasmid) [Salmonella enterica subsp. enterica]|nr:hypothetical protein KCP69_26720 [Salmonella enterica subsp. enterica]